MGHRRHPHAKLTVEGRRLLVRRVRELGWPPARAAEAQGCSAATVYKWLRRHDAEGDAGLVDRSSRPRTSPCRLSPDREAAILDHRRDYREGPHRIAWALGESPSTVSAVLRRHHVPLLRDLDRPTGEVVRYERDRPGELVHVDVKKQGRIPDGGGWRVHGRATGTPRLDLQRPADQAPRDHLRLGYDYLHIAVDDRSRVAYVEAHRDERRGTAAAFLRRAIRWFADHGIDVERVLTDNGSCYRSHDVRDVLAEHGITHKRTRPYRPQTNGKVERFNQTLAREWAYARPYATNQERLDQLQAYVHRYNHHRPHYAHRGGTPMAVLNNVPGSNT